MNYLTILIGSVLNITGDIFLKRWADGKSPIAYGMMVYVLDAIVFAWTLKISNNFTTTLVLWELFVVISGATYGRLILNEELSNINYVGIIMAIISIYMIER